MSTAQFVVRCSLLVISAVAGVGLRVRAVVARRKGAAERDEGKGD